MEQSKTPKLKVGQVYTSKIDFEPLFFKGDKFRIVSLNTDENLTPISALKLKSGKIYGFNENELEEIENGKN